MDDSNSPQIPSLCHESFWYLKSISGLRDMKRAANACKSAARVPFREGLSQCSKWSGSWLGIQDTWEIFKIEFFVLT